MGGAGCTGHARRPDTLCTLGPVEVPHNPHEAAEQVRRALKRPGKLYRRFRRVVRTVFVLLCLLPVGALIVTQGPVARWLLAREVRRATGAELSTAGVSLKLDGRLVIDEPRLRAPGLAGEAGEIARAQRVTVMLDWTGWASAVVLPTDVQLVRPVVRASLDKRTNALNLAQLGAGGAGLSTMSASTFTRVPRVDVEGGRIILGEHDAQAGEAFTTLAQLDARGWFAPIGGSDTYVVRLRAQEASQPGDAAAPAPPGAPIDIDGRLNLAEGTGVLSAGALDLSRWDASRVPSAARDVWESLRLRGQIAGSEFRFSRATGLVTTLRLRDVSLLVPVAAGRPDITGSRSPRMDGVSGTLRLTTAGPSPGLQAELTGSFEDLPARVRLQTQGLELTAPYQAVISADAFRLEKDPRILWFTPDIVRFNFDRFGGPTATVDARIELARGRPPGDGQPGETSIRGTLMLRDGTVAFEKFPYPIVNVSGTVTFDDDAVRIIGIRGEGPTGARLLGEGVVDPPNGDARIAIDVYATDVPLDDVLTGAIARSKGRELADAIFSREVYERLQREGHLLSASRRASLVRERAEIDERYAGPNQDGSDRTPTGQDAARAEEIDRQLARPDFNFGGVIDAIGVHVRSDYGFDSDTKTDVRVRFAQAGLLTRFFPFPVRADRLAMRITDDYAELVGRGLRALNGGVADLDARVDIRRDPQTGEWTYDPNVSIKGRGLRIDELLIGAIPEGGLKPAAPAGADEAAPGGARRVKQLLRELGVQGQVDADIKLSTPPGGQTELQALVVFADAQAMPGAPGVGASPRVRVSQLHGAIFVDDELVTLGSVEGRIAGPGDGPEPAWFRLEGEWPMRAGARAQGLSLDTTGLDLSVAMEDLLAPITSQGAEMVARLRGQWSPAGRLDAQAVVLPATTPEGAPGVRVTARNAQGLSLLVDGQRVQVTQRAGEVTVRTGGDGAGTPDATLAFDRLRADLALEGVPLGALELDGEAAVVDGQLRVQEPVSLLLRRVAFESPVVRQLIAKYAGEARLALYDRFAPRGEFDAEVELKPGPGSDEPVVRASLRPRALEFAAEGRRYAFDLMSGELRLEGEQLRADWLTMIGAGWTAMVNGQITTGERWAFDGEATLESEGLAPELLDMLPPGTRAQVQQRGLQAGALTLGATTLRLGAGQDGQISVRATGDVSIERVQGDLGLPVENAQLAARFALAWPEDQRPAGDWRLDLRGRVERARVEGLLVQDVTLDLSAQRAGREIAVHEIDGAFYGGRFALRADAQRDERTTYRAGVRLAGVSFADLTADLGRRGPGLTGPPLPDGFALPDSPAPDADLSRGSISAELSLAGALGEPDARTGRGRVRVAGGRAVIDLPVVSRVLELSNLQLPMGDQFDYASGEVFLRGQVIELDHVVLLSRSLAMIGWGEVEQPDWKLRLQFNSRARARVPVVSNLMEAFRDEVITTYVRGTAAEPTYRFEPLTGTRRVLAGLLGIRQRIGAQPQVDLPWFEADRAVAQPAP
jgi:hypothetical protein